MQSIGQKALLARVTTVGQDKNLDGLAGSIHVDYNPNFMDVDLLASGDEWIGSDMPTGGSSGGGGSGEIDLGNLPDDMKGLLLQLNLSLQAHESRGSPYAMNQYGCNNKTIHTAMRPYKPQFDFPNKTLYEVYVQNLKVPCGANFAYTAGKYQVIGGNIKDFFDRAPKDLREKYRNRKFDSQTQDEFNIEWNLFIKNGSLKKFFKGSGTPEKAKIGLAAEWRSLCDPRYTNHNAKTCLPYGGSKADKADYANTMKIWAIIDKMDAKMRENPNNILNK